MQVYLHIINKNIVAYYQFDNNTIYVYMTELGKKLHTEDDVILSIQKKMNRNFMSASYLNIFADS